LALGHVAVCPFRALRASRRYQCRMKIDRLTCAAILLCAACANALDLESSANPIRRVVTMLQSMQKKIEAEAEKEKELYEKYMCYCKTSGGTLQESIAAGETKVPQLQASLDKNTAKKAQTDQEIKDHQVSRDEAKKALAAAIALREKEAAEFSKEATMYKENIDALTKAIAAISKGMSGGFLQTSAAQVVKQLAVNSASLANAERDMLIAFLDQRDTYAPQGGEILGMLKQMKDEMEKTLSEITGDEDTAKADSAALQAAKEKEIAANTAAIEEKTTKTGQLGVDIAHMGNELEDTSAALEEDQKFLADLEKNCKTKESEWDEISKLRAQESVAIAETIKILNDDDALELFKKTLPSPSFVQMVANDNQLRSKALEIVRQAKSKKGSDEVGLNLIAMALHGKKVSFDKVFKLIDDLVEVLAKEQQDDDHKKEYCEKTLDKTEDKKKELEQMISDLDISIDDETETIKTLTEEIKALTDGIAALDKAVTEATETRKEEHEAYLELMQQDSAAKELLGIAKNRLNKFYNPGLYKPPPKQNLTAEEQIVVNFGGTPPPTPPPGGIAGTGVLALVQLHNFDGEDVAPPPPPESFAPYAKKAQMSNGVLAMIDMLIADLNKEMTEAEVDEKDSQAEYESLISDSAAKRAQDSKAVTDKEGAKADAETALQAAKDSDRAKKSELMATEEYMAGLHSECDWLLKNFELRKEARAGEVESLKAAKAVLAGADYSFVQQEHKAPKTASLRGTA